MENATRLGKPSGDIEDGRSGNALQLPFEAWAALYGVARSELYDVNTWLFHQGESPSYVFLVEHGLVKLVRVSEDGQESILGIRGRGVILGAESAIVQRPHPVSAITLTVCHLWRVPLNLFLALARTDLAVSWHLHLTQSDEVYDQAGQLAGLRSLSARQRVEQLLRQLISAEPGFSGNVPIEFQLPLKYREVAQLVGITPEHLSRVFKQMEREGKLLRRSGTLIVFDYQSLYQPSSV
jgi:CRP/FNR family transcriptional regulator